MTLAIVLMAVSVFCVATAFCIIALYVMAGQSDREEEACESEYDGFVALDSLGAEAEGLWR